MKFTRGADFAYGLKIKIHGEYQDISQWIFASEIRNASGSLVGQFTTQIMGDNLTLRVFIAGTDTRSISDNTVYSDLFAYPPDGRRFCLLTSTITVTGSITAEPALP